MGPTFEQIRDLPLTVSGYELEPLSRFVRADFTRRTTVFHLLGSDETGVGEDVTYDPGEQEEQIAAGPVLDLAGEWTIGSFSEHLAGLDLFQGRPATMPAYHDYRRWAIESAGLDLALRQAHTTLHAVLGREPRPLRFGVSLRIAGSAQPIRDRIDAYGDVRYKIDYEADWTPELIADLASTGAVDVIDFKGAYKGTIVDVDTVPEIYAQCAEAFPDAWLEDPDLTDDAALGALAPHRDRITWDAPVHQVSDLIRFDIEPKGANCKPSRFGAIERLFDFYDHCEAEGIVLYGGGQSELGPGRGQIQLLAAIFHPDGPNDVAPSGWDHEDFPRTGLPTSPLDPSPAPIGFRRA